jgi:hypothetical protein
MEGYEGRFAELDGYTVRFETYTADADLSPYFKGLPDDRCQCPHWGVVLKGKLVYHYADGDDVIEGGRPTTRGRDTCQRSSPAPRWSSSTPPTSSPRPWRSSSTT